MLCRVSLSQSESRGVIEERPLAGLRAALVQSCRRNSEPVDGSEQGSRHGSRKSVAELRGGSGAGQDL